jgi:aspartyl-tRNA(Asn)/glutamyl-tRNA(Gln) amidotransferase subunit A
MKSLNTLTIHEAGEGIRNGDFSVTDLVSSCLNAAAAGDGDIHAYLEIFGDARREAAARDAELAGYDAGARRRLPPLFGIPLAVKDNILIAGKTCAAGSRMLEEYTASYDATVIRRLKKHGAIFTGRTNMDEFAMGGSTENSAYGPTKNQRDTARVPGGSSGGSAAAVAADMCLGALGSDTGGSIRQPAAFCGIVGMKPTYGAVSRHGVIPMAASLNQIGPMAKCVADAAILFEAIAGADPFDTVTYERRDTRAGRPEAKSIKDLTIGVPREYFGTGLDAGVARAVKDALKKLQDAGATLEDISLPHASFALATYYIIVPSEVSADLARFDGVRYGYRAPDAATLADIYARSRAMGFGAEVKRRIMLGTYALSAGYYDAYYVKAQKVRRLIRRDFEAAFERVDVIAGPTTPTPAFALGERSRDPLSMYLADMYTVAANLAGVPALSLPAGHAPAEGSLLPVGLQLTAPRYEDDALFEVARLVESLI